MRMIPNIHKIISLHICVRISYICRRFAYSLSHLILTTVVYNYANDDKNHLILILFHDHPKVIYAAKFDLPKPYHGDIL